MLNIYIYSPYSSQAIRARGRPYRHRYLWPLVPWTHSKMGLHYYCSIFISLFHYVEMGNHRWAISYNAMHMGQPGRWEEVSTQMSCAVVGLQSTWLSRPQNEQQCTSHRTSKHLWFNWKHGNGHKSKSAGCAIGLPRSILPHQVRSLYTPDDIHLQGRLGAVRVKTNTSDTCYIVGYAPCNPGSHEAWFAQLVWDELSTIIDQLPTRCIPMLLDANAKLGKRQGHHDNTMDDVLGPSCRAETDYNGQLFGQVLINHDLAVISSSFNAGTTFYHCGGKYSSTIDYIVAPRSWLPKFKKCEVWLKAGSKLQIINTCSLRDHMPLATKYECDQWFSNDDETTLWDHDYIMLNARNGVGRKELVLGVESKLAQYEDPKMLASTTGAPDNVYNVFSRMCLGSCRKPFY